MEVLCLPTFSAPAMRYAGRIGQGARLRWQSQPTVKEVERCMAEVWQLEHGRGSRGIPGRPGFK